MKNVDYNLLKPGDVLHCTSKGFVAKAIQWFTKSRTNHTALVIEIYGRKYIIDSQRDGTNPRPIEEWIESFDYEYIVHRPKKVDVKKLQERALSRSGHTPYDFKSLLWYQPVYLITGKWKGHKEETAVERLYCSEFVAWVYEVDKWWKLSPVQLKLALGRDPNFEVFWG